MTFSTSSRSRYKANGVPRSVQNHWPSTSTLGSKRSYWSSSNFGCVTIKSLRPPKFEHEFKFDSTTSIYKVKEELAKKIGSSPDHLTLMLKTKTVHDEDLLEKVATEGVLKLNAMVKARPETTETTRETVKPASGLSPEAWAKISQILESEIVDEAVRNEYLQKLKRVRM
ncbi:hypothetical protein KL929_004391 [Ogataea haglerorum]|uniref:uncharacterized protein n=1 Tax=Ogataea haglerorum TaxID=1937702 RepID=UPI001C8AA046|nr:uncharacterized protein KL911_000414 [Ogataea haglerorum]KAG7733710.1 hypothetical protein KL948_000912 [Ogataea haglerorum]KAG7741103.1 hypothetical protein KL923_001744 [Ogataea haglerorum]KAG7746196.1 hypothetical protein KL912_004456 [Ogataea haglerorum]KAG7759277.1 hypothetical protein KL911_000414 [Ogataea haglerorum]KAG7785278.1 hypothetical protein KL945_004043 [Ogataea haglerorum]